MEVTVKSEDARLSTGDGPSRFVSPGSAAVVKVEGEIVSEDGTSDTGNSADSVEIGGEQSGSKNIERTCGSSTDALSPAECVSSFTNVCSIRARSSSPEPTLFVKVEKEVASEGRYDCIDVSADFVENEKDSTKVIKTEGIEAVSSSGDVLSLPVCVSSPTVSDPVVENDVIIKEEGLDAVVEAETPFEDNSVHFLGNVQSECNDAPFQSATSCDKKVETVTELCEPGYDVSSSVAVEDERLDESQVFRADDNSSPKYADSVAAIYMKSNLMPTVFEESYSCTHCHVKFKNASRLDQHLRSHFSEKPFVCTLCPARFNRKYYLLDHLKIHAEEKLTCTECPAKFSKKGDLTRHQRTHALDMPFSCPDCSARFQWKSKLRNHLLIHSNVKPYQCAHCPAAYKRKNDVKFHLATQHAFTTLVDRPLSCTHCLAKFRWKKTLRKHLKTHTNTSVIVTTKGDQTLGMLDVNSAGTPLPIEYPASSSSSLGTISKKEKDPGVSEVPVGYNFLFSKREERARCYKPFRSATLCNEASSSVSPPLSSSDALNKPPEDVQKPFDGSNVDAAASEVLKNSATSEKLFRCTDCCAEFKTWGYLQVHSIVHKDERPFICVHCSTKFKRRSDLTNHLRTHTNAKPFACMHCPAEFRIASSLKSHLRTHSTSRPYACSECPAKFKESRCLKSHLMIHTDKRLVACTLCPAMFKSMSNLNNHLKTHTDRKPYSCVQCPSKFKQLGQLKRHLIVHVKERSFSCSRCPAEFPTLFELKKHQNYHNSEKAFLCKQCHARFKCVADLKSHLRTHTNSEPSMCGYLLFY